MMLKIIKPVNDQEVIINIDGYTPIDIQLVDNINETPLYWRVGDDKKSLLEFAILPSNGRIAAITLVIINPEFIQYADDYLIESYESKCGFPIVDVNIWRFTENNDFNHRFIDEFNCVIKALIYQESIMLVIKEKCMLSSWIKCSNSLWLGLDDDENIVSVLIRGLSKEDINNFFNSIS
ncbi:hypothetical protein GPY51_13825 [Photorhabdus laumondii subsp. laumondii]|uniref:Photorhabdus luminescens subsp. laumondii TTO1 complete genome segment 11/17 n=2 Tax=Photorhabdus laumondii subsp. laumondii TaxID=141679 RepID=Q7N2L3_PHOLL|nr:MULTISPECIES: hypothetical protein [Photorhabdus]AWK42765.1 hypothetical protein A4R40_15310 [Photorhabdus laumondii subsp. laumondii]AXG43540.1 hypothetical protein PluDJC_15665 [Photorhabdus laumondii subsp. laumondii]AXG48083.1 hypothetical protein PluTT01m_15770 [Photorhabdus laumondii subsp. laumondii]KTL62605.1 hypothetical protein AA106_05505 [Photorhabdus laumondii subsp. laumondii]MCC8382607.1 hypothetical protein [Photorhabdus laumondii]